MKKTLLAALAFVMVVGVAIVLPLSSAHAVSTFAVETELRQYSPDKSYGGYFMNAGGGTTYLMDMYGYIVHQWKNSTSTADLMEDGTLWSLGSIQDWDGNTIWSLDLKKDFPARTDFANLHHDFRRIWNKKLNAYTMLLVVFRTISQTEALAAGGDPSIDYTKTPTNSAAPRNTQIDALIEVDMNKNIVWEWRFTDHTCQSRNPAWPRYVSDVALAPGKVNVFWRNNGNEPVGPEGIVYDWIHVNSIDYNEALGHIVINSRQWSTFFVIDHDKTFVSTSNWEANRLAAAGQDGDFIYRFGNPSAYNQGKPPAFNSEGEQQIFGAHNIQWIKPYHWSTPKRTADTWPDPRYYTKSGIALPGAGNFLIFDNGAFNPTLQRQSRVREINPYLNAAGVVTAAYVNPPEAGYIEDIDKTIGGAGARWKSKQIVWNFQSQSSNSFFSRLISGMDRLPNGNTSITCGQHGQFFEVTPSGEVVWEYIWPGVVGSNAKTILTDSDSVMMFRHHRYGNDYPGLAGRDLTPTTTITGLRPRLVGEGRTNVVPYNGFGFGATGGAAGGGAAGSAGGGQGGGY
jgi:hypothetical protein